MKMAGTGGRMEKFEEYFQKADLDRDGRISGAEAVSFLTGSNLPREVLAQIWMHADQSHTGFLSRPEFYNALKLVTVAQSKRELSPDIVKAALYGPASAKIPAPQISTAATPVLLPNSASSPLPKTGAMSQQTQNSGFRGPAPSITNQQLGTLPSTAGMKQQGGTTHSSGGISQQFGQSPSSLGMNQLPAQVQPTSTMNHLSAQVQPITNTIVKQQSGQLQPSSTGMSQNFGQTPPGTNMNHQYIPSQGNQIMRPPLSMPTGLASCPSQAASGQNASRGMVGTGLPSSNNDGLGGEIGAAYTGPATQVLDKRVSPPSSMSPVAPNSQDLFSTFSSSAAKDTKGLVSSENSSAVVPVTSSPQPLVKPDPFEALQSTLKKPSTGSEAVQTPSLPKSNQRGPTSVLSSAAHAAVGNSTAEQSQISWPKMTHAGIQRYAKVFTEVDSDRDGKITGEQARNLFLSWRLPREVLKQVWDLSDQDGDSMLSLREFCIALYLMERYREGCSLPSVLPNSVMFEESLLSPTAHGSMGWGPAAGLRSQQGLPGAQPITTAGLRPPMQPIISQPDGSMQINQKIARDPLLDNSNANQLSYGEVKSSDTKGLEAEETNEKVDDKENVLLDSREKLEFYRTKMQDLVLYKSRCDNRLNEITERARADKSEAESLEKKYQEKYKQVAGIHSKLTIEEASFREIQERKTELQQAIIKMEQGGSADGMLQVRADRIQSDLEELLKALADRCKKHSVEMKSSALIELPTGWHPGIPEIVAIWDEDWDKFEDEGFSFDVAAPDNVKSESVHRENSSPIHSFSPDSVSNAATSEKHFDGGAKGFDAESVYSADESKSPQGIPWRQTSESPSQENLENHSAKSSNGDAETRSSLLSRGFDEPAWGTNFDNNDDVDSVWGFNIKDSDHAKHEEKYFFGSSDFGASPERSGPPHADSAFPKSSLFTFEDSVPGSPRSRAGNSPRYSDDSRDPFFDSFRHDPFSVHDHGSLRQENLTRFDSISSTQGFDHSSNFSFDDSDPFGSSGPFKVSSETPKEDSGKWSAF